MVVKAPPVSKAKPAKKKAVKKKTTAKKKPTTKKKSAPASIKVSRAAHNYGKTLSKAWKKNKNLPPRKNSQGHLPQGPEYVPHVTGKKQTVQQMERDIYNRSGSKTIPQSNYAPGSSGGGGGKGGGKGGKMGKSGGGKKGKNKKKNRYPQLLKDAGVGALKAGATTALGPAGAIAVDKLDGSGTDVIDIATAPARLAANVLDPNYWARAGWILAGVTITLIALIILLRKPVTTAASVVPIGKVAKAATLAKAA